MVTAANTGRRAIFGLMLGQRRRRYANFKPKLACYLVFVTFISLFIARLVSDKWDQVNHCISEDTLYTVLRRQEAVCA